jgi:polyisoprenoid-binding protein YceI
MRLFTQIRALFVLVMLASHSPLGVAVDRIADLSWSRGVHRIDNAHANVLFRASYLGLFTFIGRFTRFEAAQQFDPTRTTVSRCPSRYVRRSIAGLIEA